MMSKKTVDEIRADQELADLRAFVQHIANHVSPFEKLLLGYGTASGTPSPDFGWTMQARRLVNKYNITADDDSDAVRQGLQKAIQEFVDGNTRDISTLWDDDDE